MTLEPRQVESLYYLGVIAGQEGKQEKHRPVEHRHKPIRRPSSRPIALGMEYRAAGRLVEQSASWRRPCGLRPILKRHITNWGWYW